MDRYSIAPLWAQCIDAWALALRAAGRTSQTIETRTEHLRRFARQTGAPGPALVPRGRLVEWAGSQEWARETRRSTYASLRGFYRWAVEVGRCEADPTDYLPTVRPGPAVPRPAPEDAYAAALAAADPRVHVVLRLAGEAGLRRAEVAQVARDDLTEDLTGWSLLVHGKGERDRLVPLTDSVAREVHAMIGKGRWLLPSPAGGHLTPRHVGKLARAVIPSPWTLHTLRHRFATRVYAGRPDLRCVQELLGHASVATTQRYVAVPTGALREAIGIAAS